ncbi:MAG TPA: heme-binding protein [Isosphaeraceae bacterium]|nr:heme-binding protein [Isosphaeraceae bacterium]
MRGLLAALMLGSVLWISGAMVRGEGPEAPKAPRPADGDAPLPVGFPDATAPGQIEVKHYPAYRSAVAEGQGMSATSSDFLFWPLFRHIQSKNIAMTAPVINTYRSPELLETPGAKGEVTMEFLYREPTQGETGPDGRVVTVRDHPASDYLCLGYQGHMDQKAMQEGVAKLRTWLDEHKGEYTPDGPPRRLGYHGPMTEEAQRLWEVQIPVKAVGAGAAKP